MECKMKYMLFLTLSLTFLPHGFTEVDFTGHKVLGLFASDERELDFIKRLAENDEVDVWNEPAVVYEKINVRVPPEAFSKLEEDLTANGIEFYVLTDDLQKEIDEEREENPPDGDFAGRQGSIELDVYHTFDAISAYIDSVGTMYDTIASVENIGTTYEGNPIKGLKIGTRGENKPALWIDSGIHAREWVAPATSLYIIEQLVKGYDTDPEIRELVDTFDWYIFPVANPDGYNYTWTTDRMWRKNRVPYNKGGSKKVCTGADPNRNFDAAFEYSKHRRYSACSESFQGVAPFSEAESRAIRDGVMKIGSSLKAYFALHAFSQLWMIPYAYTYNYTSDFADQVKAVKAAVNAIEKVDGQRYTYGTISETIYSVAGSSVDWTYDTAKIKYSFAVELRDTGDEGFILPNTLIIPTAKENFAGIRAVADLIKNEL